MTTYATVSCDTGVTGYFCVLPRRFSPRVLDKPRLHLRPVR